MPKSWKHQSKAARGRKTKKWKLTISISAIYSESPQRTRCRVVHTEMSPCSLDGVCWWPGFKKRMLCSLLEFIEPSLLWDDGSCRWFLSVCVGAGGVRRYFKLRRVGFSPQYGRFSPTTALSVPRKRSLVIVASADKSREKNKPEVLSKGHLALDLADPSHSCQAWAKNSQIPRGQLHSSC